MNIIATTGPEMAKNQCVERALQAAFKWAGFEYPVDVKGLKWSQDTIKFCRKLGLEVYTEGAVMCDARPVLVTYEVPGGTNPENANGKEYHCVFVSDIGPLHRYNIEYIVMGWENLTSGAI